MIPMGFGAGVGRVGPYFEQGNWYRGGAVQMLFITWIYGEQNQVRPMFPANTSQEDLVRASKSFDLAGRAAARGLGQGACGPPRDGHPQGRGWPRGVFADSMPVATGGRMIQRAPNDPAWYKGGLFHDNMPINVPGLWFMSWYDVSIGPNLDHVQPRAEEPAPDIANQQYAVIAPTLHCGYKRATEETVVGERNMGDARLDYDATHLRLVRHLPQGREDRPARHPAQGPLLTRWASTSGRPRTPGRRRIEAAHLLPLERR